MTDLVAEGLDAETLDLMLDGLRDYITAALPPQRVLDLDHDDECQVGS